MLRISAAVVAVCIFAASVKAQIPTEREESCGALLSSVISVCSHPTLGRPDWCCNELKRWNDARCWCEPNAFDALDTVSGNGYAFSFRDSYCQEAFQRPNRGSILPEHATCSPFESIAETNGMEECDGVDAETLRVQRVAALEALRTDAVSSSSDLGAWFLRLDALFTEDATYENVGIFLGRGRFEVKQYLMTRQAAYGFLPSSSNFTAGHFWRSPLMVSYSAGVTSEDAVYNTREFVTFERCGARIAAVQSLDDNYQARYRQFWDASDSRLLARYQRSAEQWCDEVAARCTGASYPFADAGECEEMHARLTAEGRVTCNRFEQAYVPQYASHGDTLACRSFYLDLAVVDAGGACSAVGESVNQGRCGETQCPGGSFIDPFSRDPLQAQYEGENGFTCSTTSCRENWPSAEQILSIPQEEGMEIEEESVVSGGRSVGGRATDEEIAADADSGIDTDFENDVEPRTEPVSPGSTFMFESIAA